MECQAQVQTETNGTPKETRASTTKTFPRNLGLVELVNAVNEYRQAVRRLVAFSKNVEVTTNGR